MNGMRAIHPGEILHEEFLERRGISSDTALRLARFFGTSAEFWLNLQSGYDLKSATAASGKRVRKEVQPHAA